MNDDGVFAKLVLPFEKTQKKYEAVLKQFEDYSERQERLAAVEEKRRQAHEKRERKLERALEELLKSQEDYQAVVALLSKVDDFRVKHAFQVGVCSVQSGRLPGEALCFRWGPIISG